MVKSRQLFLVLLLATINLVAWAAPAIQISSYDAKQMVGNTKFTEPSVAVLDGSTVVSDQYDITYSIVGGSADTDERGIAVSKDATTGTTVEVSGGNVIIGQSAGDVTIRITATPKGVGDAITTDYEINVEAVSAVLGFTPSFTAPTTEEEASGFTGSLTLTTKQVGWWYAKAAAVLPSYKITSTTASGVVNDITDRYDVTITWTPDDKNLMKLNDAQTKIEFAQGTSIAGNRSGTLTYSFAAKAEYAGYYSDISDQNIHVTLDVLASAEKKTLTTSFTRDHIRQENVTVEDGTYTIHVYKYGQSDLGTNNHYQYKTPTPSLLADGTSLPINGTGQTGAWGDFRFIYKIVEDNTYYDDCEYSYFSRSGSIQAAGEATGLSIGEYQYQVAKPGLIKVAAYAVLDGTYDDNGYGANLKQIYEPYKPDGVNPLVIKDGDYDWSPSYTAYAAPVYFYIDVMKRQPTIQITPDPSHIIFLKDDKVTMNSRFGITAHMDDDSNGIEGDLEFGANVGGETDHFCYSFFISDRMETNYIDIEWPNKDADWGDNEGDAFSYIDWFKTGYTASDKQPIQVGDLIKIGTIDVTAPADDDFRIANVTPEKGTIIGEQVNVNVTSVYVSPENISSLSLIKQGETVTIDNYVLITAENIATYSASHPYLDEGDCERGITYISQKGYGNEDWTITFRQNGTYNIPYTARPWNHVRWDLSDAKTVKYEVRDNTIPTLIELSYYFVNASVNENPFTEPTAWVKTQSGYDVTSLFDFTYTLDADPKGTGTTVTSEGEVTIGSTTGDVRIKVSAQRIDPSSIYENPSPVYYTIRIIDDAGRATWEIISTDATATHTACSEYTPAGDQRFDFDDDATRLNEALGRMHFLTTGTIYGGDEITGVPGISMVIGSPDAEVGEWSTAATGLSTKKCCSHETTSVLTVSSKDVVLGEDGFPTDGAFFTFKPTANGFLTVDANFQAGHKVTLISEDGDVEQFDITAGTAVVGDHTFTKPLVAGKKYYLYDATAPLRLHGFRYQPAFIFDRNTTKAQSEAPIEASTFTNSLSSGVPVLHSGSNANVTYSVEDYVPKSVDPDDYLEVGEHTGALDPHRMTANGNDIFQLRVNAVVKSSAEEKWGTSVSKNTYYHISVLDIPRYVVPSTTYVPTPGTKVYTENIKTDIVMTYGGWHDSDNYYGDEKQDAYEYKGANQVKAKSNNSEDAAYSIVIDSPFDHYLVGTNDAVNDENQRILSSEGGYRYQYASGSTYEQANNTPYNTTYRLPCRGSYYKFEPRESGVLLVYLCQNGACDAYDNGYTASYTTGMPVADCEKNYKAKWRPLFITDEKGKPVTMVNSFGNVSQFVSTGEEAANSGSFTRGLSRCDINDPGIKAAWAYDAGTSYGTSFDWSEFRGTDEDRANIIASWPDRGERIGIVRLSSGGFSLSHKAYVRYAFEVKAGKTYYVFQYFSKPLLGGFAFVPKGFPNQCKYTLDSTPTSYKFNATNQEKNISGGAATTEVSYASDTQTAADPQTLITDKSVLSGSDYQDPAGRDITFAWDNTATRFTEDKENLVVTINDRRYSELSNPSYSANNTLIKPRAFVANKWESICLPFSVSEQEMKRVFGDSYVLVTSEGVVSNEHPDLKFVRHANQYIEAGRPYFIKPSQAGVFSFRNVTIEGAQLSMEGGSVKATDHDRFNVNVNNSEYTFKGTYMRETMPKGSFFMYEGDETHENGLYRYNAADKIGGYRAYFNKTGGDTTNPNPMGEALFLAFKIEDMTNKTTQTEGEPTEVIAITSEGDFDIMSSKTGIYTLDGQKVSDNPLDFNTLPSGIYIINGKKYIR